MLPRTAIVVGIGTTIAMNVYGGLWDGSTGGAVVAALYPVALVVSLETLICMMRRFGPPRLLFADHGSSGPPPYPGVPRRNHRARVLPARLTVAARTGKRRHPAGPPCTSARWSRQLHRHWRPEVAANGRAARPPPKP